MLDTGRLLRTAKVLQVVVTFLSNNKRYQILIGLSEERLRYLVT